MKVPETQELWPWVRVFLEEFLPIQRGASPNTISCYRTAFRQFKAFLLQRMGGSKTQALDLVALEPSLLLDFLGWLESSEGPGVGPVTRNLRLAALRSFFRFLELYSPTGDPTRWQRLRHLPAKREGRKTPDYLELFELEKVFREVPASTRDGFRDLAVLSFLYNTGARASEAAGLRVTDLTLDTRFPQARFIAKGRVRRVCPLWPHTAKLLDRYIEKFRRRPRPGAEAYVFINQRGGGLTRSGVRRRAAHYISLAAKTTPSLRGKKLSVHSIRHTTAIHLIESGADVHVVRTWLGHRSTKSTDRYLNMDLEPYRELLGSFTPPSILVEVTEEPADKPITEWLEEF